MTLIRSTTRNSKGLIYTDDNNYLSLSVRTINAALDTIGSFINGLNTVQVQSFTNTNTIRIAHSQNSYPLVQVLDASATVIVPLYVVHSTTSDFTVQLTTSSTGSVIYGGALQAVSNYNNVTSIAASYTAVLNDDLIICTGGTASAYSVTLPTASGITGKIFDIKNQSVANITITTTLSQTIDGDGSLVIASGTKGFYPTVDLQSDGSNWVIV